MTEYQTAQLAALRERHLSHREIDGSLFGRKAINELRRDIDFLLTLLADAEREQQRFRFDLLQQINYLAGKNSCPCGAREETPATHPHVSGCGIGMLRREFSDAIEAGAKKD